MFSWFYLKEVEAKSNLSVADLRFRCTGTLGVKESFNHVKSIHFLCVSKKRKHEAEGVEERRRLCAQAGARKHCTLVGSWSREDGDPAGQV